MIRLNQEQKYTICKKCFSYLQPEQKTTRKDGTEYYPIKCRDCNKITYKKFIKQKYTKEFKLELLERRKLRKIEKKRVKNKKVFKKL